MGSTSPSWRSPSRVRCLLRVKPGAWTRLGSPSLQAGTSGGKQDRGGQRLRDAAIGVQSSAVEERLGPLVRARGRGGRISGRGHEARSTSAPRAGKSTLLNALAGAELLPMNNVPETARICKLVHDVAAVDPFLLEAAAAGSAAGDAHQPSSSAGAASKKDAVRALRAGGRRGGCVLGVRHDGTTTSSNVSAHARLQAVVTARGEAAVRARLQHLNQAARSSSGTLASASSLQRMLHRTLSPSGASAGTPTAALTTVPSLGAPTTQQDGSLGLGLTSTDSSDEAHLAALLVSSHGVRRTRGLTAFPQDRRNIASCAPPRAQAAQAAPAVATGLPADKMLSIHVPIAALLEYEQGGAVHADGTAPPAAAAQDAASAGSRVRLQLLDTPGPNEAGEEGLKHQVGWGGRRAEVALHALAR